MTLHDFQMMVIFMICVIFGCAGAIMLGHCAANAGKRAQALFAMALFLCGFIPIALTTFCQ